MSIPLKPSGPDWVFTHAGSKIPVREWREKNGDTHILAFQVHPHQMTERDEEEGSFAGPKAGEWDISCTLLGTELPLNPVCPVGRGHIPVAIAEAPNPEDGPLVADAGFLLSGADPNEAESWVRGRWRIKHETTWMSRVLAHALKCAWMKMCAEPGFIYFVVRVSGEHIEKK